MSAKRPSGGIRKAGSAVRAAGLLALIAVAFAPVHAPAQQPGMSAGSGSGVSLPLGGWVSGLSIGRAQIGIRDSLFPVAGATRSSLSEAGASAGYKLYGRYQFNRILALEGGYADLGNFDARRVITAPVPGSLSGDIRASASGFYMGAEGVVPLPNRFSLFGKLGTSYSTRTAYISGSGAVPPLFTPVELGPRRSEWNSKYGLGANYEMSNKLGLRFEYERSNTFGDGRTGEGNVGMWSLGLTKRY